MMSAITPVQVSKVVATLGPLTNVFLIGEDSGTSGLPIVWYPEIGFRYLLLEKDELAAAVKEYLRAQGVRRFASETDLAEAHRNEQWPGWDTCADYVRIKEALEQLQRRTTTQAPAAAPVPARNDLLAPHGPAGVAPG